MLAPSSQSADPYLSISGRYFHAHRSDQYSVWLPLSPRAQQLLAYIAIDIDFDDNKPHVLIKQRFMYCAFTIRKCFYGVKLFFIIFDFHKLLF